MIIALPLIMLYNGERGQYSLKYLFYAFTRSISGFFIRSVMYSLQTNQRKSSMTNIVLQTKDLTKKFGAQKAVDAVNITAYEGEVFGFLARTARARRPRSAWRSDLCTQRRAK